MEKQNYEIPSPHPDAFQTDPRIQQEECITYVGEKAEYVPYKGILIYKGGAKLPTKGFPTIEAITAINIIKKVILTSTTYFPILALLNKNKLLSVFNIIAMKALIPNLGTPPSHLIKDIYLCPTAYNTRLATYIFLSILGIKQQVALDTATITSHLLEYDDAYRYRVQDIATEMNAERMKSNPRKEILRLHKIFKERCVDVLFLKTDRIIYPFLLLLFLPKIRKAFTAIIPYIQGMVYDEADRFWVHTRGDNYKFLGLTTDERNALIEMPEAVRIYG